MADKKSPSPNDQRSNDQRSDVKNPNNPNFKQDRDNRSRQMNPNNDAHPSRQVGQESSIPGSSSGQKR